MKVNIDVCTYTVNVNGVRMVETRYSQFDQIEVKDKYELEMFVKGFVCALRYKYSRPAVRLNIIGGETIEYT